MTHPTHGVPAAPTSPGEPSVADTAEMEVSAMSVSHRSSHYWFWFLIFGVIPLIEVLRHGYGANSQTYEAFWLLGTGLLGLLVANKNLNGGQLAKPYDVLVGVVFTFAGVIGIAGD